MKLSGLLYRYSKGQRKGILALFLLIVIIHAGYFMLTSADTTGKESQSDQEKEWLSLQPHIDSLKALQAKETQNTIYPFNPNYITDAKGYALGMSTEEIDRLLQFRKQNKFVNSAKEFQQVTKVSDSLLAAISPYFKFPDWVVAREQQKAKTGETFTLHKERASVKSKAEAIVPTDINDAVEEDLVKVYGIGRVFARKIMQRRADLGAYVSMEQMDDFKEFSPEAIAGLKKYFIIGPHPDVNTINVNTASLSQLSRFPYFNRDIARSIITQRSMKGKITDVAELLKINGFSVDKVKIIALYLEF